MKKLFYCVAILLAIVACTKGEIDNGDNNTPTIPEKPESEITITSMSLNFPKEGGSENILFSTTDGWTAEVIKASENDWLNISPSKGNAGNANITVTTTPNEITYERVASICIKSGTKELIIKVSQKHKNAPFDPYGILTELSNILMTNYIGIGEHCDFGLPSIFGATDRMCGEVFPTSGNMPDGNQYYDRWQWCLYTYNSAGLNDTGYGAPLIYNNYYAFINTANTAISNLSDNPGPELGVAKAFRASSYLDLARLYDPLPAKAEGVAEINSYTIPSDILGLTVPIVTENTTEEDLANNPRVSREKIFEFIFNDLDEAENLIGDYKIDNLGMPSLSVVYGLKARAYLWLGGFSEKYEKIPTGEEAYRLAADYAHKAIISSYCNIMTLSDYGYVYGGFGKANNAWMWGLQQTSDTVLSHLHSWTAHMSSEALWGYGNGAQPGINAISYARMNDTDFRKSLFNNPERDYNRVATCLTKEEYEGGGNAISPMSPYASFKFRTNNGEKYDYNIGNVTDIPMMRIEEMYLIQAEATAHYDIAKGERLFIAFMENRDHAYSVPEDRDLIEEIIFQKRIEFWGEGLAIYDMKRLNIGMLNGEPESNAPKGARFTTDGRAPWWNCVIPISVVQQNKALEGKNNPNPSKTYLSKDI